MRLVIDVGNTETVMGLASSRSDIAHHWRLSTLTPRTADEVRLLIRSFLDEQSVRPAQLDGAVIGSVVPATTETLVAALGSLNTTPVHVVDAGSGLPIRLAVEEPLTVGADRIVNTLAAKERYGRDTIAVDLGTATTFDLITAQGEFQGGVIAPGVSAGLEWLGRRTAKLPRVAFHPPDRVIGRRTETCIQSGIFYGVIETVDGIVRRIVEEWGRPDPLVVATGGFAGLVAPHCRTIHRSEPLLTLFGLAIAGEHLDPASSQG